MVLVENCPFSIFFIFKYIAQEKVFYDILEQKKPPF